MNNKAALTRTDLLVDMDLKRTEHPSQQNSKFYWEGDDLIHAGLGRILMAKAMSRLPHSLKESFQRHLISFSQQGDYAPNTYETIFKSLQGALTANPTNEFDTGWIAQALINITFRKNKFSITRFFLHWQERDRTAISTAALLLLDEAAAYRSGPRNVLSDDPEKSWLTDEEYDGLLRATWDNYDRGATCLQVTLIKLLSMQYARRPIQMSLLKVGDVRESDDSNNHGITGRIVDFPGVKDRGAVSSFRDSKFEPHPLPDHLWTLCQIQRIQVKELYEHTLGLALTDDQLNSLPLFCSEVQIEKARKLIESQYRLNILEHLDSEIFHLPHGRITAILRWKENKPSCDYGAQKSRWDWRPEPPISPRTGDTMVVYATRMRHTRARQLARQGVPRQTLSHWLGHTQDSSLSAYYSDPAEQARELDEAMAPLLTPLAMAFTGKLIDSEDEATRANDPTSKLEFAITEDLKSVGRCGKHSFCATTSLPIPCYRCKYFEPLVDAPHEEVLAALMERQAAEKQLLKFGGQRILLIPIDLSPDIRAVENCIARCITRKIERENNQ